MILGRFAQSPEDDERYSIYYGDWLDENELLSNFDIEVAPLTSPPLEVHDSELSADQQSITFYVTGGQLDTEYTVSIQATTNGGPDLVPRVRNDCVKFSIQSGC